MEMQIREQARQAVQQLLSVAGMQPGQVLVVGCSSSEVGGGKIGTASNLELACAVFDGIYPLLQEQGIALAAQCCEHLNRALVVERDTAARYGWEEACVIPRPKAGGSFATTAFERFVHPVVVEHIRAHAGIDIGDTLIGMHLREVAVPVRIESPFIGSARVVCARTRPRLIGGSRAYYGDAPIR